MRNEISAATLLESLIDGIMASGTGLVIDGSFFHELEPFVEQQSLASKSPEDLVSAAIGEVGPRLLDFGCGTGGHRSMLESLGADWVGLNYKAGMATDAASSAESMIDDRMHFYNGLHVPFENNSFDIVYSFQTFEHIQDIGTTFSEIARILKPSGRLVGAVSYLEQIHDYSTFNFTPYGFKLALAKAGFTLRRIYPRSDVFTFLLRRLLVATSASDNNSLSDHLGPDNFVHKRLAEYVTQRADIRSANLFRLMFSTHFSFDIEKASDSAS